MADMHPIHMETVDAMPPQNLSGDELTGLIDVHIHTAPDVVPRRVDDLEAARDARDAGMRAIVIKSHVTCTADRAAIAEKAVGGIRVFGGLALNKAVGSLNPAAVDAALGLGAKIIWMPTHDAAHSCQVKGQAGGITLLDSEGDLRPEAGPILELIRDSNAVLST
ncbi:MAG: histidinol phosphatase, partial [Anaerolineae bacterium]|nr:histidinol phosphatase [Anaerolineae bacterium]